MRKRGTNSQSGWLIAVNILDEFKKNILYFAAAAATAAHSLSIQFYVLLKRGPVESNMYKQFIV